MAESVLLVEGNDDLHVISGLLQRKNFPEVFKLSQKGGIDNLLSVIPVQIKASNVRSVGIVADADLNLENRWHSISSILESAGYSGVPREPERNGVVIIQENLPKIGVWLMPDNLIPGMLEDFVAYLVPEGDELFPVVRQAVGSIQPQHRRFPLAHQTKAEVHTWLAWQEEPGTPMGLSIAKRYLDPDAPNAAAFLGWLRRLFVE